MLSGHADNIEKAYGLWTQMQDEDVQVTDEFLIKLGNFMKSKNLEVPFVIPESGKYLQMSFITTQHLGYFFIVNRREAFWSDFHKKPKNYQNIHTLINTYFFQI